MQDLRCQCRLLLHDTGSKTDSRASSRKSQRRIQAPHAQGATARQIAPRDEVLYPRAQSQFGQRRPCSAAAPRPHHPEDEKFHKLARQLGNSPRGTATRNGFVAAGVTTGQVAARAANRTMAGCKNMACPFGAASGHPPCHDAKSYMQLECSVCDIKTPCGFRRTGNTGLRFGANRSPMLWNRQVLPPLRSPPLRPMPLRQQPLL